MNHGIDWLAILRTLLVQIIVLLALAGAVLGYLSWSSAVNVGSGLSVGGFVDFGKPSPWRQDSSNEMHSNRSGGKLASRRTL
jgi:hypothetical protein